MAIEPTGPRSGHVHDAAPWRRQQPQAPVIRPLGTVGLPALLLLLLLLCTSCPQLASGAAEHHIVCTSDNPPMSMCNSTADPATFNGFDIALFRRAALQMGWTETSNMSLPGETYEFVCRPFSELTADLTAPNGTCMLATAGITISSERENKGIKFSYPSYRSSLSIMVYAEEKHDSGWFFLRPFDWTVWLAIVLTVAAVPLVTFVTEFISIEGRIRRRDVVPGLKEASWRSLWTMMLLEPFQVTAISSRVIAVIYGFLATVLINTYCANLAAALTVSQLATSIKSVDDLRGKAVGTVAVYIPRLARLGVAASEVPFDSIQSAFVDWVPKLRDGTLVATAIDEPVQQYVAALGGCELRLVDSFAPFDFGLAFRAGTNQSTVEMVDDQILALQEDGSAEELRATFIAIPRTGCDSGMDTSSAITFSQVAGLWIILGIGFSIALIWLLGLRLWNRYQKCLDAQAAARATNGVKGAATTGDHCHPLKQLNARRHSFRAGVAFRQTVSVYGVQIGANRREAEAVALEESSTQDSGALKLAVDADAAKGGWDSCPDSPQPQPVEEQSVMQLLAHIRQLCDRMEAQAARSH